MADPNTREAIEFLRNWNPNDPWVLTSIMGDVDKVTETRTFSPDGWQNAASWIESKQGIANVYFHPNPAKGTLKRKAQKTDIARLHCLHVDIDPRNGEELFPERERILGLLLGFTPAPSVIIDSGNGYQAFWLLEPDKNLVVDGELSKITALERYSRQLELLLGGDNCFNLDRLMRLPGTINVPDAKKRAKGRVMVTSGIVRADYGQRYLIGSFTPAVDNAIETGSGGSTYRPLVRVSGNIADVGTEELQTWAQNHGKEIKDSTLAIIAHGNRPEEIGESFASRSEALFRVVCDLVRAEVPDDMILGVITGSNPIADSVREKRGWRQYAIRQIERAKEDAVHPWVRKMNDRHAVITNMAGKCRVITEAEDLQLGRNTIQVQTFEDIRNAYLHKQVEVGTDSKGNVKHAPVGHWWLSHGLRRTYDSLVFAPGRDTPGSYNLWKGFGCDALPGKGHELFLDHVLHNLCEGNESWFAYLINWCARMIQNPASQGETAVVFRGKQGTGKSFFARTIGSLLGPHFLTVADSRHLVGNFNGHLRDTLLLFADEAFFAGDKRHEGVIKTMITEPTLVMERKGVDAEVSPNYVHLIMASNEDWVVPAALDDRRFFVLEVSDRRKRDNAYFATIQEALDNGGRENLLHYLLGVDLSNFNVREVPQTTALMEQKMWSMSGPDAWLFERLQDGFNLRREGRWVPVVSKEELFAEYLQENNQLNRARALNAVTFSKFIRRVFTESNMTERRQTRVVQQYSPTTGQPESVRRQVWVWEFPTLERSRELWEYQYGKILWKPIAQQGDEPEPLDAEADDEQKRIPF